MKLFNKEFFIGIFIGGLVWSTIHFVLQLLHLLKLYANGVLILE